MPTVYPVSVKMLGIFLKHGAVFPPLGLGHKAGKSEGDLAVKAIKVMAVNCIERAVFDEAGAIDGSRPLEMVADSCGFGWGSTIIQMAVDLTRFKVLLMAGKEIDLV